jgi:hypothetical protein
MKQLFPVILLLIFSCNNNHSQTSAVSPLINNIDTSASFFPVTSFIKGQILQFDSIQITPLHIIIIKEKADSNWLKTEQLKSLLNVFIIPEIKEKNLIRYFKETKFNDQTINAITFTYDPVAALPDSIGLRTWNVYIDPKNGSVTKIYIVKDTKENNQVITQQLTWETNKLAQITNILNKPDGSSEILKQEKFIWNLN